MPLQPLAPNVFLFPHDPDPERLQSAVGVVVTPSETVLIDAGHSPTLARMIMRELREIGAAPVTRVVLTHHHWDHTFGTCAYGAPAVAHRLCREKLQEKARKPWGKDYVQRELEGNPRQSRRYRAMARAQGDWQDFRIVVPEESFEEQLTIRLENLTLELLHVGGQHAADSTVVTLPEARVMFLGDCYYPPPPHLRTSEERLDLELLESLLSPAYDLYISGHTRVMTRAGLERFIASQRLARRPA